MGTHPGGGDPCHCRGIAGLPKFWGTTVEIIVRRRAGIRGSYELRIWKICGVIFIRDPEADKGLRSPDTDGSG
jgi:hypothetical protein